MVQGRIQDFQMVMHAKDNLRAAHIVIQARSAKALTAGIQVLDALAW